MKRNKKFIAGSAILLLLLSVCIGCSKEEDSQISTDPTQENVSNQAEDSTQENVSDQAADSAQENASNQAANSAQENVSDQAADSAQENASDQAVNSAQDTLDEELKDKAIGDPVTIYGVTVIVNSVALAETSSGSAAYEVNVTYQNHSGSSLLINPYDWSTVLHTGSDKAHVGGDVSFHSETVKDGEEWTGIITLWKDENTEKIKFESSDLNFLKDTEKSATWIIPEDLVNAVPENQISDEELENKNIGDSVTIYGTTVTVNSVTETTSSLGQDVYEVSITYVNNTGKLLSINPYDWSTILENGSDKAHVGGESSFHLENLSDGEEWTGIITLWKDDNTQKIKFESSYLNMLKDEKSATWLLTAENG